MSFFSCERLHAGYDRKAILSDISFSIDEGHLTGVIGANGSGKTTLLKSICGILPHRGKCTLDGEILEGMPARKIAQVCSYIPQRSGISIDISVLDVVLMGFNPHLKLLQHPNAEMKRAAMDALRAVGLSGRENDNYLHLSEGQKQLCVLARMLVSPGKLLLLDEPESALDFRFRYRMLEILRQSVAGQRRAAIVALHDPNLALNLCDRLLLIAEGCAAGVICPRTDPIEKIESMLENIYGKISLHKCANQSGREQIVMLKEDEP